MIKHLNYDVVIVGVGVSGLEIGDQINVLTTENLATKLKLEGTRNIPGYLILVEE